MAGSGAGTLECTFACIGGGAVEDPRIECDNDDRSASALLQRTQVLAIAASKDLRGDSALWKDEQFGRCGWWCFERIARELMDEAAGSVGATGFGIDGTQPGFVPWQHGTAEIGCAAVDHDSGTTGCCWDQAAVVEQQFARLRGWWLRARTSRRGGRWRRPGSRRVRHRNRSRRLSWQRWEPAGSGRRR